MELKKLKKRIILMQMLSFLVSILPLLITVVLRWDNYIQKPSDAVKLSIGGIVIIVLIFLKAIGKLRMPQKRVIIYSFMLVMCYLLSTILNDITFLIFMATIGEVLDLVICQPILNKAKEQLVLEKNADATTNRMKKEMKNLLDEYSGGRS